MRNPIGPVVLVLMALSVAPAPARDEGKPGVTLMYTGPEDLEKAEVSAFEFMKYKPGDRLFVASHNSNLRKKPRSGAEVVATLPMAARVKVLKPASGPTTVIGKVDRWYRVEVQETGPDRGKQGYLFGMLLTPAAFTVDLDGDGEQEIVTAAFAQNFKIRIRVREPKVDQPDQVSVDVDSAGGAYVSRKGGLAEIRLVPREKAGVALVEVFAHVEACADFATHWVSYTVPDGKPGVIGEPRLALTQSGIADPPVHSLYEVSWDPRARTATAVQTTSAEGEDGKERKEKTTRRYRLVDGVYQEVK